MTSAYFCTNRSFTSHVGGGTAAAKTVSLSAPVVTILC